MQELRGQAFGWCVLVPLLRLVAPLPTFMPGRDTLWPNAGRRTRRAGSQRSGTAAWLVD
jgi:hypothetical protein